MIKTGGIGVQNLPGSPLSGYAPEVHRLEQPWADVREHPKALTDKRDVY